LIERRVNERASALSLDEHVDPDMANTIAVRRAIAALPHRQKTVLILIYYADMTSAQVADLLECPEGTVKSLAHRAIKRLSRNQTALRIEEGGGLEWRGA
jgi:RNA polymerase sigma-70 factor (ECF subfamily)